jgi:non-canonical poly(A) RNA polymerase PAPD5/7
VFRTIATVLKRRFPKGESHLFGSVSHNLCLPDGYVISFFVCPAPFSIDTHCSDLDVCFEIQGQSPAEMEKSLYQFARVLKAAGISDDVLVNKWAKVPVISLTTKRELGQFPKSLNCRIYASHI